MFYIGLSEVVPSPPPQGETEGERVRLHIGLLYIVLLFHLSDWPIKDPFIDKASSHNLQARRLL